MLLPGKSVSKGKEDKVFDQMGYNIEAKRVVHKIEFLKRKGIVKCQSGKREQPIWNSY